MTSRDLVLRTADGVDLEARVEGAHGTRLGSIVICHPHPEYGGTMRAPLIGALASRSRDRGYDVLRFNFRGVGTSKGVHGGGEAEILDVDAAVAWMTAHHPPLLAIIGWSFGAATALRWEAQTHSSLRYIGISPPVQSGLSPTLPPATELVAADRTFIVGDRDQLIDVNQLVAYAGTIGATVIRYETADHFFLMRHDRVADDALDAIER